MARDILDEIIENKRTELIRQKQAVSPAELRTRVMDREPRPKDYRSLRAALCQSKSGIIAEFKRKSPSKGWIHPEAKVADVLPTYERSGAAACSILTDSDFFGGSLGDLREARSQVKLPLLRKDFIIDPYQIDQALLAGADAILLIAAALSPDQYDELADQAHEAGLEVLLEIHDEAELDYIRPNTDVVGINNRHLGSFHTDVATSFQLANLLPEGMVKISESGLSNGATIRRLREAGFRGFLIGESLMRHVEPGDALAALIQEIVCE